MPDTLLFSPSQAPGFIFLELRDPDEATALLLLDGIPYRSSLLKLRRPSNFNPQADIPSFFPPAPGTRLHTALHGFVKIRGAVSTEVPEGPNKLFLGNVPAMISAGEIKQIAEFFGRLKASAARNWEGVEGRGCDVSSLLLAQA
jgi:splicing factor U2AF subunit